MKKKIRRVLGTVAFFLCGILLFLGISEMMRRKTGGETDMVHSFYEIEKNILDVVFLGSSHLYYGIQPNELWKEHGITSYVLGSPEQTAATSYFLLKEAFSCQQPEVVVLETYYLWYNGLYNSEARLRQAIDGMRFGSVKLEAVDTMLPEADLKEKLSYYLPFLQYHSRWNALEDHDFHTKPYLKGARIDFTTAELENPGLPETGAEIPEINLEYLEKIRALCEENGSRLVLLAIPYGIETDQERYDRRQGINLTLEEIVNQEGIADQEETVKQEEVAFLFYQKDYPEVIDFATDFRDKTHLNTEGARKLSAHLGAWLAENCDLEDHREESGYESWEEDLALYETYVKELQEHPVDTADDTE